MLHVLVLIVHVLLLGQVKLGVLHAGLLVPVLSLVQVQLGVAQAGHVRDRDLVPRILIIPQFHRACVGPSVYFSVSSFVCACPVVVRPLRMTVHSAQLVYGRHFGCIRKLAGKLGPGVVVPGLMVHDCHQRVLLVAVVGPDTEFVMLEFVYELGSSPWVLGRHCYRYCW